MASGVAPTPKEAKSPQRVQQGREQRPHQRGGILRGDGGVGDIRGEERQRQSGQTREQRQRREQREPGEGAEQGAEIDDLVGAEDRREPLVEVFLHEIRGLRLAASREQPEGYDVKRHESRSEGAPPEHPAPAAEPHVEPEGGEAKDARLLHEPRDGRDGQRRPGAAAVGEEERPQKERDGDEVGAEVEEGVVLDGRKQEVEQAHGEGARRLA
jgi:hypothetical protein